MICPFCGTHIDDGLDVCPACHADLAASTATPHTERRYCASCGAIVPEGATFCPSCGMPLTKEDSIVMRPLTLGEEGAGPEEVAGVVSALPAAEGPFSATSANERFPRRRVFIFAFAAALVLVGGVTLAITQPWNPNAYSTKATTEADTSKAGYPGEVEKLTAQDKGISTEDIADADAKTFETLTDDYSQLGDLRSALEESEKALRADLEDSSADIDSDYATAKQNALDISNLATDIANIDTSTGTYADDVSNLSTLASWLRNWSDDITDCYNRATTGYVRTDAILEPLTADAGSDGTNAYAALFDQNYGSWQPQQK